MMQLSLRHPLTLLIGICAAQALLWTLAPALLFENFPLDSIENIGWGREWQLGYYKHPPLQSWLTVLVLATGAVWPLYLLSQLAICAVYVAIYALGREIVGPVASLWAVVLCSLVFYFNIPTPEFNANVVQMPIWAWSAVMLWWAITRRHWYYWVLLGALAALAFYAKYSAVILWVSLFGAMIAIPDGRKALSTKGPYLAALSALALMSPQLWWLQDANFMPFDHLQRRSKDLTGIERIIAPLRFLLAQLVYHGGVFLLLAIGFIWRWPKTSDHISIETQSRNFVLALAFIPLLLSSLYPLISGGGIRSMWGAPMANWTTLAVVMWLRPPTAGSPRRRMLMTWMILFTLAPLAVGALSPLSPTLLSHPKRTALPGEKLAQQLTSIWRGHTNAPLRIVAGSTWHAGVIGAYSPDRPAVFFGNQWSYNPWVTPELMHQQGVLMVWEGTQSTLLHGRRIDARGSVTAAYRYAPDYQAVWQWAIQAPQPPLREIEQ